MSNEVVFLRSVAIRRTHGSYFVKRKSDSKAHSPSKYTSIFMSFLCFHSLLPCRFEYARGTETKHTGFTSNSSTVIKGKDKDSININYPNDYGFIRFFSSTINGMHEIWIHVVESKFCSHVFKSFKNRMFSNLLFMS